MGFEIKMKALLLALIAVIASSCQERISIDDLDFNEEWRFAIGTHNGAESIAFDDSAWRTLNLPHDWAIEAPFDSENNARTGGLPVSGTAWYRKAFYVDDKMTDKIISIEFDGAMNNASLRQ